VLRGVLQRYASKNGVQRLYKFGCQTFLKKLLLGPMVNWLFLHHVKSQFKYGWRVAEFGGKRV
jgi:hypothetical protein